MNLKSTTTVFIIIYTQCELLLINNNEQPRGRRSGYRAVTENLILSSIKIYHYVGDGSPRII